MIILLLLTNFGLNQRLLCNRRTSSPQLIRIVLCSTGLTKITNNGKGKFFEFVKTNTTGMERKKEAGGGGGGSGRAYYHAVAGLGAGTSATLLTYPLDLIRTRFQGMEEVFEQIILEY
jgi:hypothetical protein